MKAMSGLVRLLGLASGFNKPIPVGLATEYMIRRLASPCPGCGQKSLDGHTYCLLATQIAEDNEEELRKFIDLYLAHKWAELSKIQMFGRDTINTEVFALFCTHGGCMLAIRSTDDVHESNSLLEALPFGQEEADAIRSLQVEPKKL